MHGATVDSVIAVAERPEAQRELTALQQVEADRAAQEHAAVEQVLAPVEVAAAVEADAARAEADVARSAEEAEREAAQVAAVVSAARPGEVWRSRAATAAVAVGALGLLCSVALAVGALLAALEAGEGSVVVDALSRTCDLLSAPLGALFSFSGEGAEAKTDLVTRGVASMLYLAVGLVLPSLARHGDRGTV